MKILCFIDSLGSGGAQRQLVELAIGFKERGHDVTLLIYHDVNFYEKILEKFNINVVCVSAENYIYRFIRIRRYIRNGKFDSVISFLESPSFIATFSSLPFRNWSLIVGERSSNPAIFKSLRLRFYRLFHLFSDYVVFNSYANMYMVKKINPFLSDIRLKVIYNIVDEARWKIDYQTKEFKKTNVFKLIVLSSHQYLKNLNGLIEAVNLLTDEEKSRLEVIWYGDSIVAPYFDNSYIEAITKIKYFGLDNIFSFYSATPDVSIYLKEASALGLFSFYEGLPNAVCEAMFIGKPVIASNISDIPLLLKNELLLFDPQNILSISTTIKYLLELDQDELANIGDTNREIAYSLFRKDKIIDVYLNLLQ